MIVSYLSEGVTRWHLESSELTYLSAKKAGQPELFYKLLRTVQEVNIVRHCLMIPYHQSSKFYIHVNDHNLWGIYA